MIKFYHSNGNIEYYKSIEQLLSYYGSSYELRDLKLYHKGHNQYIGEIEK